MTTYEKSQALSDAGIKFPESKEVYLFSNLNDSWELTYRSIHRVKVELKHHPEFVCDAPSMRDLWERLPNSLRMAGKLYTERWCKRLLAGSVGYYSGTKCRIRLESDNPCTALADLLLWCKTEGHLNN